MMEFNFLHRLTILYINSIFNKKFLYFSVIIKSSQYFYGSLFFVLYSNKGNINFFFCI